MKTGALLPTKGLVLRDGLTLSVETSILIRTVLDAVHEVRWPRVFFQRAEEDTTPEPVLRGLLSYCLVKGICGAHEIEAAVADDPGAEYLAANYRPKWQTIHEFRRRNLNGLKDALAVVICRCQGEPLLADAFALPLIETALDCLTEANRRLFRAIKADSMVLDW
ncbi:MAG TPA: hypothetical protein VGR78_12415 [Verrucomicrobiae bacterium]|jgi:hypothetical protein|nr:hypothetical protein [Verrucomicrobiae bacterium]